MTFIKHYSSSAGNLYEIVAANGARLLIDPGVPWAKLARAVNFELRAIEGCLVSHEHMDHCKAVKDVMRNGIDVYASLGTWHAPGLAGLGDGYRAKITMSGAFVELPSFRVLAFDVIHNVAEPLGYIVYERQTGEYLLFAVDTQYIKSAFPFEFSIVAIGCNFDLEKLGAAITVDALPEVVGVRIVCSHPSVAWVEQYLTESVCLDKCREIHLLHCSDGNLDREKARKRIEEAVNKACPFSGIKVI